MYLFKNNGHYEIIAEDNQGTYTGSLGAGVHFCSDDCITWQTCDPMTIYTRNVFYKDRGEFELQRRERPQIFFDGKETYLFTTAKINGETRSNGGDTWNMIARFKTE